MLNGTRIREAREALGYSQSGLADALGVHEVTVWRWENDPPRRIDFHTARRLADALELDVDGLFCDEPRPGACESETPASVLDPAKDERAPAGARSGG